MSNLFYAQPLSIFEFDDVMPTSRIRRTLGKAKYVNHGIYQTFVYKTEFYRSEKYVEKLCIL